MRLEPNFNKGDKVQLKLGGPEMVILRAIGDSVTDDERKLDDQLMDHYGAIEGDIICFWSNGREKIFGPFPKEILHKLDNH